jgi:hypothetical protein
MNDIRAAIEQAALKKGTIHRLEYIRDGKTRAKNPPPARIRKRTVFSMRMGHSYYNQEAVKEKHESGERGIAPNPNMRHLSPAIVENIKTGQLYAVGQPIGKPEVVWEMGGNPVSRSEIEPFLLASEYSEGGEMPDHLTLKIEDIAAFQ